VFVGDTVTRVVMVFDIPGQRFFKIGKEDPGGLSMPLGLDVDRQGNLYVVDGKVKQVMVYDRNGKFLRSIAEPAMFNKPAGLAVDAGGRRVYVVDIGGVQSQEHRVRVFDAQAATSFDFGSVNQPGNSTCHGHWLRRTFIRGRWG
jgi:DNA-binding beta-propeller fold protein YncE